MHNTPKPQPHTTESANNEIIRQLFERVYTEHAAEGVLYGDVLSYSQLSAVWMYDVLGLNVFPGKIRSKIGGAWQRLQYTRLHRAHPQYGLMAAFAGRVNIRVMVGATSSNLFVLDCETDSLFQWVIAELKTRRIRVWAVKTARGGHVWLRCIDGTVKSVSTAEFLEHSLKMEVRGHTGYVMAPPSVHPTGLIYDWHERQGDDIPTVSIDQINFLPVKLALHTKPAKRPNSRHSSPFWPTTQDYLQTGHLLPIGTRHERFRFAVVDYIRNGFGEPEIRRDLVPIAERSGLPDLNDPNYFSRIIGGALRKIQPRRQNMQRVLDWQRAESFVARNLWQGRTGSTDRAVALALVERAKTYSNEQGTFRASYREIGTLARITDRRTVQKSLERLKSIPFVLSAGTDELSAASLWRFSNKALQSTADNHSTIQNLQTDAMERGAIGKTGMRVWQAMLSIDTPAKPAEIAHEAGLTVHQVYRALRPDGWLMLSGLIQKLAKGWIAHPATAEQLDDAVAMPAGKLGNGQKRKTRFDADRAINAGKIIVLWREQHDRENRYV